MHAFRFRNLALACALALTGISGLAAADGVAKAYLLPSNRTLARFVPTENAARATITEAPPVSTLVNGYTGRAGVAACETFDPTPANIAARTQTFTIGDGLLVSLLPRNNPGGTVVLSANFRFGDEALMRHVKPVASALTGAMLMRGSKSMNRTQINQRFEVLKTSANVSGSSQGASISLQTRRNQLVEALTVAADILRNPTFPESEFEQMQQDAITVFEASRRRPGTLVALAMGKAFDPWPADHPLHHRDIDEALIKIKALTIEQVRAFHHDNYGTSAGQIAIVGDFDPEQVTPLLEKLFANWKPAVAYAPLRTHLTNAAARKQQFETPIKSYAVLIARHNVPLSDDAPDYAAIMVANDIFGDIGLASRLGDRVRQKEDLSYNAGSWISYGSSRDGKDDAGSFNVQAIAMPQNIDKIDAAVHEELARFVKDGITEKELKNAVKGALTQREQERSIDARIADMLNLDNYLGRSMLRRAEFDARLKTLTVAEVNAALRRYLKPDALSGFMAGDFAAANNRAPTPTAH